MDLSFPPFRMRAFHGHLQRLLTGIVAAALLLVAVPAPATAAPTPNVTITDVTVTEGTGGTVNANFTIVAAPSPKAGTLQVTWATAAGSATSPADFTASSGTVPLTKSSPSKVVSVPVAGDAINESNETFVVNLTNLVGSPGTITDAQGVGTITDNDPVPVLSVNDVSVTEGNVGTTTATFTVTLSAASGRAATFQWTTTAGSATAGVDYVAASGSRTIAAGATTATVGITVDGDFADELDETFGITLSNPGNATIGDGSGLATVSDDDPVPVLSVNDISVTEGNTGTATATFTVSLSAASGKAVTFDWTTNPGTATAGTDYVAASGSPTIAAGATTTTFAVTVNGDVLDEANETFGVTLSNLGNATIGDGSGLGTITDDDAAPTLSVNDVTITEGNAGTSVTTFTVSLSSASASPVTFNWSTNPGTATPATDYVAASGNRTIAAGATTTTFGVTVNGDVLDEANETFDVTLSNPGNATISDGSGLGTITDDDAAPSLSVNDVTIAEGDSGTTIATFTVTLSAASGQAVTFDWASAAGSATASTDYVVANGSRTIAAGTTTTTLGITVNGDVVDELNETFGITLSNAGNATISDGSGVGTITDDDAAPSLSVNDVTVVEGNAGTTTATFDVTLSAVSGKTATVDWTTANNTATQPSDYTAGSGTLTFVPGDSTESIVVTVNGDVVDELAETFGITLSNPGNATISDGSGVGTITDDDTAPILSVNDVTVVEGNTGTVTATFTATLSAASGQTVTVTWATADDMAIQPADYTASSGLLTFVPGDTSETFGVTVKGDIVAELDETLQVLLTSPSNAVLGDPQGLGTIQDDELLPVIDIDEPSIVEGQSGTSSINFNVILSHPSSLPVTVDWTTAPGTATAGTDYVAAGGTVMFAALDVSETVSIIVKGDGTFEGDETFTLDLSNSSGVIPIGDAQGVATIVNDDAQPILSVSDASVVEGNTGTSLLHFTVSVAGTTEVAASVDYGTAATTATAGSDFVSVSGTHTIPAGSTTGTVNVVVNGDLVYESNETLSLVLSNPVGATIGGGSAQGTILNDDKAPTAVTVGVVRKPRAVIAKGLLEPASPGERVTVTLFRKKGGKFVKVSAKTVLVRYLKDRDGDGKTDGSYAATLVRPKAKGSYKIVTQFKGTANYKPSLRGKVFTLTAR
jgi:large repetitive protein